MVKGLSGSGHTGLGTDSTVTPFLFPSVSGTPGHRICHELMALVPLRYTLQHIPTVHPSSQGTGGAAQDEAGSTCPAQGADSTALGASPVSCPKTEHKGALTCLHLAPRSVQGVSVRMAPVIGTGSLGPISPQRSNYHVIWSGGDTVCMESLGHLQGGADLTPRAHHPHPCLGTSDNSWKLLRRSTRATEQRAGRVFCVPCGRTQV